MKYALRMLGVGLLAAMAAGLLAPARAADVRVSATDGALTQAIEQAAPQDRLLLSSGVHKGGLVINKPLTIEGEAGAIVDSGGEGSVFKIFAANVTIKNLTIRGSGAKGENFDSGIYVEKGADTPIIEGNAIQGNLFGIVLHGCKDALVKANVIANRSDLWLNDRGNGIHIWNNTGARIESNRVRGGRDGIYIEASHQNVIHANRFEELRFAIHYMYANANEVSDNVSIHNRVGFALMYSKAIKVMRNVSVGDLQHGLMLHTTYKSEIFDNYVYGTGEKCLFIYTSASNSIHGNRLEQCGIGVHFTGGSENNKFYANAFLSNETQVKYTGLKVYEWSDAGKGNYWSDHTAFDLDGDGVADAAYRPNTLADWLLWKYPLAKLLISSPALQTLRFVQEQLPALYPGGAIDSFPLMMPPTPPVPLPAGVDMTPAPRDPAQDGSDSRFLM